jgi:hypothetical protein
MEHLIKEINKLRPTEEQVKDMLPHYAFGYVDALNSVIKLIKNLNEETVKQKEVCYAFDWCKIKNKKGSCRKNCAHYAIKQTE